MGERTRTRTLVVTRALAARLTPAPRSREVRRVLVAHNLLLGDTLMLTPLLAKLKPEHKAALVGKHPLGRLGQPGEVAPRGK